MEIYFYVEKGILSFFYYLRASERKEEKNQSLMNKVMTSFQPGRERSKRIP